MTAPLFVAIKLRWAMPAREMVKTPAGAARAAGRVGLSPCRLRFNSLLHCTNVRPSSRERDREVRVWKRSFGLFWVPPSRLLCKWDHISCVCGFRGIQLFTSQRFNDLLATSKFNQEAKAAKPRLLPNVEVPAPPCKAGIRLPTP